MESTKIVLMKQKNVMTSGNALDNTQVTVLLCVPKVFRVYNIKYKEMGSEVQSKGFLFFCSSGSPGRL